jgi:hypothetical protein
MAYKYTINKAMVNREAAITEIHTQLLAMGWDYVDGICAAATGIPYTDVNVTDNTFTKVGHTFVNGDAVQVQTTGTVPGGLAINTRYFVVDVSGSTFKLTESVYNGAAIDITSQGTGNHTIFEAGRIYKSTGENSDRIPEYIYMYTHISATIIYFRAHYKYSAITKVFEGSSVNYYLGQVTTNQTGFYLWIWGNKNHVLIGTKVVSTYYESSFGWIKAFFDLKTAFTQAATSGDSAVLNVTSTVGFEVGYSYQILGATLEGRDNVTISEITNSTQMKVSNLPRNYSSGSLIGNNPSVFGVVQVNGYFIPTCSSDNVGLENNNGFMTSFEIVIPNSWIDPDYRLNKYILQPCIFSADMSQNQQSASSGGYLDENILSAPSTGMVIEDTFAVGKLDSGTSTGTGNTTSVMNDTGKLWTVNAFANKVVVIIFGAGAGMIKKIVSNTATAITISSDYLFEAIPDNTSQYIICDEGYRYFSNGTGVGNNPYLACREGI